MFKGFSDAKYSVYTLFNVQKRLKDLPCRIDKYTAQHVQQICRVHRNEPMQEGKTEALARFIP